MPFLESGFSDATHIPIRLNKATRTGVCTVLCAQHRRITRRPVVRVVDVPELKAFRYR